MSDWIEVNVEFGEFENRGLFNVGTLMLIETCGKTEEVLIGDINDINGSCDHCKGIEDGVIVKSYKVICTKGECK